MPKPLPPILGWISFMLLGVLLTLWWRRHQPQPAAAAHQAGWQAAGKPLAMPAGGEVDFRFAWPSAWQTAQIPPAARMDPPLGSEHGALVYNAQAYQEMNAKRGGRHFGDDLNGIGGMNTDRGDPVRAVADGLVIYAAQPSPGWGNVVVIAHRTPGARPLHSMYAHLERMDVGPGVLVARGMTVGTVGTANDYYPAHLHFELTLGESLDLGAGYGMEMLNRLDPTATVAGLRGAAADDLTPSPLALLLENER